MNAGPSPTSKYAAGSAIVSNRRQNTAQSPARGSPATLIPPGATNFPFHAHAAQWEVYIVISGSGELRAGGTVVAVTAGDSFVCPPGEPHQLKNTSTADLLYYVIADNPPADVITYPDSNKWFVKPQRKSFTMQETDYYANEE